jgi:hypothetical protein
MSMTRRDLLLATAGAVPFTMGLPDALLAQEKRSRPRFLVTRLEWRHPARHQGRVPLRQSAVYCDIPDTAFWP